MLENVRAEAKPTGAAITLTGNGELIVESVTPFGDGTPRVVLSFRTCDRRPPRTCRRRGRYPRPRRHDWSRTDDARHCGSSPACNLSRAPPEEGEKEFTILSRNTSSRSYHRSESGRIVASLDHRRAVDARRVGVSGCVRCVGCGRRVSAPGATGVRCQRRRALRAVPQQWAIAVAAGDAGAGTQKRFTGHPVTLDSRGPICARCCARSPTSDGLNIVIDQSVQGAVDVSLHEVPWDQALATSSCATTNSVLGRGDDRAHRPADLAGRKNTAQEADRGTQRSRASSRCSRVLSAMRRLPSDAAADADGAVGAWRHPGRRAHQHHHHSRSSQPPAERRTAHRPRSTNRRRRSRSKRAHRHDDARFARRIGVQGV